MYPPLSPYNAISGQSRILLIICALIVPGLHRLICRRYISGIIMLFTAGLFGIWTLIDIVLILFGSFRDSDGRLVLRWL